MESRETLCAVRASNKIEQRSTERCSKLLIDSLYATVWKGVGVMGKHLAI